MTSIFRAYEEAVHVLWKSPLSKAFAIELSNAPRRGLISANSLRTLCDTLSHPGWTTQTGSNWVWRSSTPRDSQKSDEVRLEREIAAQNVSTWTCQMSTSSGVQPNGLNRRRAIDLVRFNGNDHYAFIELKVGSDNPLYAAFEILGYALAYLQAKNNGWRGEGRYDVFAAKQIELTVLGPDDWYRFKTRNGKAGYFDFDWLAEDIAKALNELSQGEPIFSMAFRSFGNIPLERAPSAIHGLAEEWI